ncbi:hypothetical protein PPL_05376 [Heterostelium album PN500]|uniref:DDE Tnp4 domain-containing protein n=1 Tax=Heterostelium pallidum (strain ATCC 26659 / Pp 5 / PN500) TaxID=670386 RepID=D3BA04_HETP5|nr:hypothetical protein PPL_05376 [Heterostelium album PN500]EFA81391.1 hypothetical protein PPL_05376 [Heterostelium album PN500]|eukprot:XP_020433509.1 hypothetical protein PPL_05376 [Heterostelium album PN500]
MTKEKKFYEYLAEKLPTWGNDEFVVEKYGVSIATIDKLLPKLKEEYLANWTKKKSFNPYILLMTLNFLKTNPSYRTASKEFGCSKETYQKRVSNCLQAIANCLPQIEFKDRYGTSTESLKLNLVVDTTLCPIEKPSNIEVQRQHYSEKHKTTGLKYEIGVRTDSGLACWLGDPYRGGEHDINILLDGGLLNELDKDEVIFADKGYQGVSEEVITPIKGKILSGESETLNLKVVDSNSIFSLINLLWNWILRQSILSSRFPDFLEILEQIVENFNCRFKRFGALKQQYRGAIARGEEVDYSFHKLMVEVVVKLCNFEIQNGSPLRAECI